MQNHQLDLSPGESIILGSYTVTLLEVENQEAVIQIEGPDGNVQVEPASSDTVGQSPRELALV